MCYNEMYAPIKPAVGQVVKSLKGHDAGRLYIIAAVLSAEFVLLVDGKYRTLSKPKTKRYKHLKTVGESSVEFTKRLLDSDVRKAIAKFQGK